MKTKYVLIYVFGGVTREKHYPVSKKQEAIQEFKKMENDPCCWRAKLFSIDSEDDEIWYDIGKKVLAALEARS